MLTKFLNLGKQPIANNFIPDNFDINKEYFYNLEMGFDTETLLVTQMSPIEKTLMFNENYAYSSSTSMTMQKHFKFAAENFISKFDIKTVAEIGSNDGIFLRNFLEKNIKIAGIEPCNNFANLTNSLGIKTFNEFWDIRVAKLVEADIGKIDLIFAANCMCHISDLMSAFTSVESVLNEDGIFVFEDPSLLSMLKNNSYDQIYDEHVHIFSIHSLLNALSSAGLRIFDIEQLAVHGGSNRIFACKNNSKHEISAAVNLLLAEEINAGINDIQTYFNFAKKVEESKNQLLHVLLKHKKNGKRIISYGATSKSTTVFNYCNINNNIIDFVIDTTPAKINKLTPGTHIPIKCRDAVDIRSDDVVFLGAWNFEKEILEKEQKALDSGTIFISHVPHIRSFSSIYNFSHSQYHEDDRAQRILNAFNNITENSQFNVSYVNSIDHVVAWHGHHVQTDQWMCLKGSFKVGLAFPVLGSFGKDFNIKFVYLSDKDINKCLTIHPGILHGYKALEPGSIMLYHNSEKYDILDEIKYPAGSFEENWNTKSR